MPRDPNDAPAPYELGGRGRDRGERGPLRAPDKNPRMTWEDLDFDMMRALESAAAQLGVSIQDMIDVHGQTDPRNWKGRR